ncbi:MAG: MopE-related protein, partial [Polyangiales bacterium]
GTNRLVATPSLMNVTGTSTNVAIAATDIDAGYYHSCAVLATGGVRCWGRNDYGQLGDGSVYGRTVGYEVVNLTGASVCTGTPGAPATETCNTVDDNCNGVVDDLGPSTCTACTLTATSCTAGVGACARTGTTTCGVGGAISTGASEVSSCAVMGSGVLRCWGYNGYNNLGDGTTTQRSAPVGAFPSTLTTVAQMAGGFEHECVRLASGQVQCWGYNAYSQLGDNSATNRATPVTVLVSAGTPLDSVNELSLGYNTSCALRVDGTVWCWGYNGNGEVGDNTTTTRALATRVTGLTNVVHIGVGHNHGCAVKNDGTLWCWGYNANGQLGDGSTATRLTPVQVSGISTAVEVVAGSAHTCARLSDNTVRCWGRGTEGQLGNNGASNSVSPVTVLINASTALTNARGLTATYHSVCARLGDGTARCWGWNAYGQIGDGTGTNRLVATVVQELRPGASSPITLAGVSSISGGHYHVCASLSDLTVRCWGRGDYGQIGDGAVAGRTYATEVLSLTNGTTCSATPGTGTTEVCDGVDNDCNGVVDDIAPASCSPGACGTGRLACSGTSTTCAVLTLTAAGTVCRGAANACDPVETCTGSSAACPADVGPASGFSDCSGVCLPTGGACTVGTGSCSGTGTVVCGVNAGVQVAPGYEHTCVLLNNRTIRCVGYNGYGQLGDGTTTNRTATVAVSGVTTATSVVGGYYHACARLTDGTARCWGYNGHGEIGDNTATTRVTATVVSGLSNVRQLDAGIYHTCAVLNDGTVRCWGYNGYGQIGDNTTTNRLVPTAVSGLFNVVQISAGGYSTCAVKSNGTVWCWGYNVLGLQLRLRQPGRRLGDRSVPAGAGGGDHQRDERVGGLRPHLRAAEHGRGAVLGLQRLRSAR